MIVPLLVLLTLVGFTVLPFVISIIGVISIKGLTSAFVSLVLSGAVALKALITPPPPPRVSYGVVRPYEVHHDHWHRSEQEVNQPYKDWTPEFNGEQYLYQDNP